MVKGKDYVIHSPEEIERIRRAAHATAQVRDQLAGLARVGMSTKELDELAGQLIAATGGTSAFLGYRGYPGQICISINDQVVHGIGTTGRILQAADVVSIDVGVQLDGAIGDTALTFAMASEPPADILRLLEFTRKALEAGIAEARPGNYIRDISGAVARVAKAGRLGIVREFVGHGCGTRMHEPPEIPNYITGNRGPLLRPGMVLAIEPMLNLGSEKVYVADDKWTVYTRDGSCSAHFEHTILITEKQPEILTWPKTT